jgi:methionyl aminopeptidase
VCDHIEDHIRSQGVKVAFPTCLSINEVAAHDAPGHNDRRTLKRGDLVKLDLGARVDGYIADTAVTVEVGTRNWTELIRASETALQAAIELVRPNIQTRLIGAAIERAIESFGYRPISNLTGHSIGLYQVHSGKSIPNVGDSSSDILEEGDTIAIEPFATNGAGKVKGKRTGNIYRIVRDVKDLKPEAAFALYQRIYQEFDHLPFAERWCTAFDKAAPAHIQRLMRKGVLTTYASLLDAEKGMVSQKEHTMIVTSGGPVLTTA